MSNKPLSTAVAVVLIILGLYGLYLIRDALFIIFIAALVATAIYPAIVWLEKHRVPRSVGVASVFTIFLILTAALGIILGNILVVQGQQFLHHLPQYGAIATDQLKRLPYFSSHQFTLNKIYDQAGQAASQGGAMLLGGMAYVFGILGSVLSVFTIYIFSFLMLSDTQYYHDTLHRMLPPAHRERILRIVAEILVMIGAYVRGQLLVTAITGLLVAISLTIMNIPYASVLGILMALLDIIPVVGPLVAMVFGILITLGTNPLMIPWVILVYLVAQQIENAFIFPFIMNKSVKIHSSWILLSIFLLSSVIGIAGVVLAVPVAIIISILVQEFYLKEPVSVK